MALAIGRAAAAPILVLNFCMYMIVLGIAGWALNRFIDQKSLGNAATQYFLTFALIAGVVGVASTLAGLIHLIAWKTTSLAASASSALTAWLLTLLAFGLACKEIHTSLRGMKLRVLEAFMIILAATQLLYVMLLHAGLLSNRYGPGFKDSGAAYGGPTAGEPPKATTAASAV